MDRHRATPYHEYRGKKLTLKTSDHSTSLQKHLHKQWTQGQHCDLDISAGSCRLAVHSCVLSCFSAKISCHLLKASRTYSVNLDLNQYHVTEGGLVYYFLKTGEKNVGVDVEEELLKALVGYMYTGCLSVPYHQVVALLHASQLLGFDFVVNVIELFLSRNPELRDQRAFAARDFPAIDNTSETHVEDAREQASNVTGETEHESASEQHQSPRTNQSTRHVELGRDNEQCGDVPLPVGLNMIKQEIIDPDLQELLNFSAQVEGSEGIMPSTNELHVPESHMGPETEAQSSEDSAKVLDSHEVMPVIKQEVLDSEDNFPDVVPDTREQHQTVVSDSDSDLVVNFLSDDAEDSVDAGERHSSVPEKTKTVEISPSKICDVRSASEKAGSEALKCAHCKKSFCSRSRLKRHVYRVHDQKNTLQQICRQCGKHFTRQEELKSHCRNVHMDHVCDVKGCDFRTVNLGLLSVHLMRVHKKCSCCDYQAPNIHMLKTHREENHAMFPCPVCQHTFSVKKSLIRHQRTCTAHKKNNNMKRQQTAAKSNCLMNGSMDSESNTDTNSIATHAQHISTASTSDLPCPESAETTATADAEVLELEPVEAPGLEAVLEAVRSDLVQELNGSQDMSHEHTTPGISASPQHSDNETLQPVASIGSQRKGRQNSRAFRERQCQFCGKQHDNREMLFLHLRNTHSEKCFSCEHCSKTFMRKEGLTNHVRSKHVREAFTCPHCDEVFDLAKDYSAHCRVQHNDLKPFRCKETSSCRFRGRKLSYLEHHREHVHNRDHTFACHKCGRCFPSKLYLHLHQRSCLQLEQHLCSVCGEVFGLRQLLSSHIQIKHLGQRRYSCTQCGRRFSCHANRNRHMRIHDNAFPYMCEVCGEKFRHSNSLKDHVSRKHGKKPS